MPLAENGQLISTWESQREMPKVVQQRETIVGIYSANFGNDLGIAKLKLRMVFRYGPSLKGSPPCRNSLATTSAVLDVCISRASLHAPVWVSCGSTMNELEDDHSAVISNDGFVKYMGHA